MAEPLEERFWSKVDVRGPDECWPWTAYCSSNGYGRFGRCSYAHRTSYEINVGPIPEGMFVCHRCDNPPCQNPAHLFLGTCADNTVDMDAKGRRRSNPPSGEKHLKAKLTEDDVREIRRLYDSERDMPRFQQKTGSVGAGRALSGREWTTTALADKFGVDPSTIGDIINVRIWRHVA